MKFSLAIALSHNADLIIMDEPHQDQILYLEGKYQIYYIVLFKMKEKVYFSPLILLQIQKKIADYITFINKGEIVFSKTKDEVLETYAIVKGGTNLLNKNNRKQFIGLRETSVGFEALIDNTEEIKKTIWK